MTDARNDAVDTDARPADSEIAAEDIIRAVNDKEAAEALMKQHGWTREELLCRAETLAGELASRISRANVV